MLNGNQDVIAAQDVGEFFLESVVSAIEHRRLDAREETVVYLVNLLSRFIRSDRLYEWTPDGYQLRPLALVLNEALQASGREERNACLQRVGDVSLFVAGLFADSLQRRSVDLGYYISMGETAYDSLAGVLKDTIRGRAQGAVFEELAESFPEFVDVLGEVGDNAAVGSDTDIMHLYASWLRTGSRRSERKLRELGVQLSAAPTDRRH